MRKSLEDISFMVRDIPYPKELPEDIKHLHAYVIDGGHCIMAIPECLLEEAKNSKGGPCMYEIPLPVRYVLAKGYRHLPGTDMITVDVPYDPMMGADPEHEEYDEF